MVNKLRWVERPARCGDCEFYKRRSADDGICDLPFKQNVVRGDDIYWRCPLPAWDFFRDVRDLGQ